jgi:hypothetical protein
MDTSPPETGHVMDVLPSLNAIKVRDNVLKLAEFFLYLLIDHQV